MRFAALHESGPGTWLPCVHVRVHGELWRVSGPRLYSKSETLKLGNLMARLPQQYAPLVYGLIQAAITTAVATAIATRQLTDFHMQFVKKWLSAWGLAFLTMLPVVVFVSPFIQRCVLALTVSTADDG